MDVKLSSTDEDEEIDVEGDIDDITINDDITMLRNNQQEISVCDETIKIFKNKQTPKRKISDHLNGEKDFFGPFERKTLNKKLKFNKAATDLNTNTEITDWWKTVKEIKTQNKEKEEVIETEEKENKTGKLYLENGIKTEEEKESSEISETEEEIESFLDKIPEQEEDFPGSSLINPVPTTPDFSGSSERSNEAEERIVTEYGEEFQPPREEAELSLTRASEHEREHFEDFFSGATKYTPDRYMVIRNAILKQWEKQKPEHVNKVVLRPILRRKCCGNVNNIGRIHRYLESIGAINFGSSSVWWKTKVKKKKEECQNSCSDSKLKRMLQQRMSGRSRKKPVQLTFDLLQDNPSGGYTIDHANNNAIILPKPSPKKQNENKSSPSKKYNLISCRQYTSGKDCPYDVTINASSLVVMDTHSHLSKHEVMGLLGGYVNFEPGDKVKVHIVCAQPCKSAGSSRHCEMDPVSQSQASEYFITRGQQVVGWYHSHPTFPPIPSITDIKTQLEQQTLFSSHGSVFLGLILSPYNRHQLVSQVNLVHVSSDVDAVSEIPYQVPYKILSDPQDGSMELDSDFFQTLSQIIRDSSEKTNKNNSCLPNLLDPIVQGSNITHLKKLIKSLSSLVTSQGSIVTSYTPEKIRNGSIIDMTSQSNETSMTEQSNNSDDIVTSPENDDLSSFSASDLTYSDIDDKTMPYYDETIDSYSIQDNFPSLSQDSICIDNFWNNNDLQSIGDCDVSNTVTITSNTDDCDVDNNAIPHEWKIIFKNIQTLLLNSLDKASKI